MTDYLIQFKALPKSVQDSVSTPESVATLEVLERRYGVGLAELVLQVLVRAVSISALTETLVHEQGMEPRQAEALASELRRKYFSPLPVKAWLEGESTGKTEMLTTQPKVDIREPLVAAVLVDANIAGLDPDHQARLENAIRLRLHEVRDVVDTRSVLTKPTSVGGVELSSVQADQILDAIARQLPRMHEPKLAAPVEELLPPQPITAAPTLPLPAVSPSSVTESAPIPASEPPAPVRLPPGQAPMGHKPSMIDVRSRPEVVGPIDELRLLSLAEFRRLNPDPSLALARIRQKLELLKDESHEYMMQGLQAWRESATYQAYLTLMRRGLVEHRSVAEILREQQATGDLQLSEAEFLAILKFNKDLRM